MKKRKRKAKRKQVHRKTQQRRKKRVSVLKIDRDEPFKGFEELDAKIIMADLQGVTDGFRPLAYRFRRKNGKHVEGLSIAGVQETVRQMARRNEILRPIGKPTYEFLNMPGRGDMCIASVTAGRYVIKGKRELLMDTAVGTKNEPLKMRLKTGAYMDDRFVVEKATTKAERNAKLKLIRGDIRARVLQYAIDKGLVQEVESEEGGANEDTAIVKREQDQAGDQMLEWMKQMLEASKLLGRELYLHVLTAHGFESPGDVHRQEQREAILKDLRALYSAARTNRNAEGNGGRAKGDEPAFSIFGEQRR
jgi:hypothetical protein